MLDLQKEQIAKLILTKSFKDLTKNPLVSCGCNVGLFNDDDLFNWKVVMHGPVNTPYAGGFFYLSLKFPKNFPEGKPEVKFLTPIYHLNINNANSLTEPLGHVCISCINYWEMKTTIREILRSIFALFFIGNPNSAYGQNRQIEFNDNKDLFEKKAKYFTKKYAKPNQDNFDENQNNWDFTYNEEDDK